jgi:hypothetical protein
MDVTEEDRRDFKRFMDDLENEDRDVLEAATKNPLHFTVIRFRNHGGVVMPLPLEVTYEDGRTQLITLPAEVWKLDSEKYSKMLVSEDAVVRVELDPFRQIGDADRTNNMYPPEIMAGRFQVEPRDERRNPMQSARTEQGRIGMKEIARKLGVRIIPRWDALENHDSPMASATILLEGIPAENLQDPWGDPLALELSSSPHPGENDVILVISSAGPDRKPDTRDDITIEILANGVVQDARKERR